MSWYYNGAGQRFPLPERPLEPPKKPFPRPGRTRWPFLPDGEPLSKPGGNVRRQGAGKKEAL